MSAWEQDQLDFIRTLFVRADKKSFLQVITADTLSKFVASCTRMCSLRDSESTTSSPIGADVTILKHVPSYESYRHFHNRILTPGIPGSLLPVESLYKDWYTGQLEGASTTGMYLGPAARHIQALCSSYDIQIPQEFAAMPDHIVLLIELADFFAENVQPGEVRSFVAQHFDWIGHYASLLEERARMEEDEGVDRELGFCCRFYTALLRCIAYAYKGGFQDEYPELLVDIQDLYQRSMLKEVGVQ